MPARNDQSSAVRRAVGYVGHRAREGMLYLRMPRRDGRPSVAVLPSTPPFGSSLLRAYRIGDALGTLGWRSIVVPPQLELAQRHRVFRIFKPDILLVEKSRHALNDPAHLAGIPFVLDFDDADFGCHEWGRRLDALARDAVGVIASSRYLARWAAERNEAVTRVWTGTPLRQGAVVAHGARAPIVTWASGYPADLPDEQRFIVDVMKKVAGSGRTCIYRAYGYEQSIEPALREMEAAGITCQRYPMMRYEAFLKSLQECAVGLMPVATEQHYSKAKSFGKVLGYLDAHVPVVAHDALDHDLFFTPESGLVTNDPARWVTGIGELLADAAARDAMAAAAFARFEQKLTTQVAARQVDQFLRARLQVLGSESAGRSPLAGA